GIIAYMVNKLAGNMAATTTIDNSSSKKSFCIEALLARSESPSASSSPSVSPPISPGSEDVPPVPQFVPRPGLLPNASQTSSVAAAIFQNHQHAVYGYPNHHHPLLTGGSAFHPLDATAGAKNGGGGAPGGGNQHLQHMQLEWLARTGMFYPRLPDLTDLQNIVPQLTCFQNQQFHISTAGRKTVL
ncbi:hypothetical protein L9F63_004735, partial [Diploptera punctata]